MACEVRFRIGVRCCVGLLRGTFCGCECDCCDCEPYAESTKLAAAVMGGGAGKEPNGSEGRVELVVVEEADLRVRIGRFGAIAARQWGSAIFVLMLYTGIKYR